LSQDISLIVGLGNPDQQYLDTRHNVGFWFTDKLCETQHASLNVQPKFLGRVAQFNYKNQLIRVLQPTTYMNLSGQSVVKLAHFYKIDPKSILVVHDELDLPPGTARLKLDGGHGGHNGLRNIISLCQSKQFYRLRIGIGHPGHRDDVHNYVLHKPKSDDRQLILGSMDRALQVLPDILSGQIQSAMNKLHTANQ
jgi:PTH1 family peptidyl-tRNA hydrolase